MKMITKLLSLLCFALIVPGSSYSQIIAPTGITSRASSQLVYYYDQACETGDINDMECIDDTDGDSEIQVTNTNDTTPVTIHVQIFRSYDPNDSSAPEEEAPPVICEERNFFDTLTPNDTHVYDLGEENFNKNIGESVPNPGETTSLLLDQTKGFVIITPVVSDADATAISFQHLIGHTNDDQYDFAINALGRDAVDFTTGEIVADGTPLDGVTAGYVVLQPEELIAEFVANDDDDSEADFVGVAFNDVYGPAGLLGYTVTPATVSWTSFIFDFKEDPTSCGNRAVECFLTVGLNDTLMQNNENFLTDAGGEDTLCPGVETPDYDDLNSVNTGDTNIGAFGWTRIFVSGYGEFTNHVGYKYIDLREEDQLEGGDLMHVKGERTEIDPGPVDEVCDDEIDNDEDGFTDCEDTDCATAEECETGVDECTNETDDDGDGDTDCADLGCDGTVVDSEAGIECEFGLETSCDDGFDNDGDGTVDGDDTDCQAADTGGTGGDGDGGGCVVTGTVSTSSSVVNFLVLMLPFIGVFGIRRFRNKVLGR